MRFTALLTIALLGLLAGGAATSAQKVGKGKEPADDKKKENEGTLSEIGGKSLKQWVEQIGHKDPSKRVSAIKTVLLFGPEPAKAAVPALIAALKKHRPKADAYVDASVLVNAPVSLATILIHLKKPDAEHNKEAIGVLTSLINDAQITVRLTAIQAITRFGPMAKEAIPNLIKKTTDFYTWETRHAAVQALGVVAWDKEKGPSNLVTDALYQSAQKDGSAEVRLAAIHALMNLGVPNSPNHKITAEHKLVAVATGDSDRIVRIHAYLALYDKEEKAKAKNKVRRAAIAKYLQDAQAVVRAEAAKALSLMKDAAQDQLPALLAAIQDTESGVRAAAIWAVGAMSKTTAARAGIGALLEDPEPLMRLEAVKVLGNMGADAKDQLPALVKVATADKEPDIRGLAIFAIAAMGVAADPAIPALQGIADDAKQLDGLRHAAKEAIDHIKGKNKKGTTKKGAAQ